LQLANHFIRMLPQGSYTVANTYFKHTLYDIVLMGLAIIHDWAQTTPNACYSILWLGGHDVCHGGWDCCNCVYVLCYSLLVAQYSLTEERCASHARVQVMHVANFHTCRLIAYLQYILMRLQLPQEEHSAKSYLVQPHDCLSRYSTFLFSNSVSISFEKAGISFVNYNVCNGNPWMCG